MTPGSARVKAWRLRNPEKARANEVRKKRNKRLRSYGTDPETFEKQIEVQQNLCAICNETMEIPCQDHCHETNRPRSVLCKMCNTGLGMFRDSPELLHSAAKYLEGFRNALDT